MQYILLLVTVLIMLGVPRVAGICVSKYTLSRKTQLFSHIRPKNDQFSTLSSALCSPIRPSQVARFMARGIGKLLSQLPFPHLRGLMEAKRRTICSPGCGSSEHHACLVGCSVLQKSQQAVEKSP